jgi:hypothetical protein
MQLRSTAFGVGLALGIPVASLPLFLQSSRTPEFTELFECPDTPSAFLHGIKGAVVTGVEPILDVHEFHDCQRLVVPRDSVDAFAPLELPDADATVDSAAHTASSGMTPVVFEADSLVFGPLVGVFARNNLHAKLPFTRLPTFVAAIYNYSRRAYTPLGLSPGFSCLYLFRQGEEWSGGMLPNGPSGSCPMVLPNLAGTKLLYVNRTPWSSPEEVPPAARWQWDAAHAQQLIGVRCGAGWCEIGGKPFTITPPPTPPDLPDHHTRHVKGWYDDQFLTVLDAAGNAHVGPIGVVYPMPGIRNRRVDAYDWSASPTTGRVDRFGWIRTATVVVQDDRYKQKFNLAAGGANEIYLRHNTTVGRWQMKITSASNHDTIFGSKRYDHTANMARQGPTPGTARWRWILKDDGIWVGCGLGCCYSDMFCTEPNGCP